MEQKSPPRPTRDQRKEFAGKLAELRVQAGLSQADITEELRKLGCRIRQQAVSGWEAGKYAPDLEKAVLLDHVMGANGKLLAKLGYPSPAGAVTRYDPQGDLEPQIRSWTRELADIKAQLTAEQAERQRLGEELAQERSRGDRLQDRVLELERRVESQAETPNRGRQRTPDGVANP